MALSFFRLLVKSRFVIYTGNNTSILANEVKPYYSIVKNEAAREASIYIYGVIGGIDWDTYEEINTAKKFTEEFSEVEAEADTIHVRINSPGGYVFEGLAIYNALYASSKKIITYNDGLCASMAALILLAGDEIHGFSNSLLMIHNSSSVYWGNKKEVEKQLEASLKIDESLGTAIEERLGIDAAAVSKDYLNYEDNWFTAKEAQEAGFYDVIIKKNKAQTPKDALQMNSKQLFDKYAAMSFSIPEIFKPKNKMSKPKSYPMLEKALGIEQPLASTDNGSYLNEEQKEKLQAFLETAQANEQTAKDAQATAEQALKDANATNKTALDAAVAAEKANTTAVATALKDAATLAGVEDLAADADAAAVATALTAQIKVLNKKPGDSHTGAGSEDPKPGAYDYLDYSNSIYSDIK